MNNTNREENVQNDKLEDVWNVVDSLVVDVLHQTLKYVRDVSSVPLLKFELDELRKEAKNRLKTYLVKKDQK